MAFYQCPKCKKTWQYPIEKCPDCFQGLERLSAKTAKVIGVSQSFIPTILHPKTSYFILVLEDENGNKWAQKFTPHRTEGSGAESIKEYKIGDVFNVTRQDLVTKDAVAIWRIKYDILEAIEKVIELAGGLEIKPQALLEVNGTKKKYQESKPLTEQAKILILPTLIAPKHPYFAVNTNPKFLDALLQYLKKQGAQPRNIKVAAQSFDEVPIEASAQKSQLLDVCLAHQITPFDLAKSNFIKREKEGFACEISEEVFNSDLIINLPILRLDIKMGVKGAAENSLKLLKKESYFSLQYFSSPEEILENVQEVLPNHLTIADAQTVQKTNGFTTFLGLTLASFNPLNLDRVFAEICLVKDLPECLKKIRIKDIPIIGRKVEELQYEVEKY